MPAKINSLNVPHLISEMQRFQARFHFIANIEHYPNKTASLRKFAEYRLRTSNLRYYRSPDFRSPVLPVSGLRYYRSPDSRSPVLPVTGLPVSGTTGRYRRLPATTAGTGTGTGDRRYFRRYFRHIF